MAKLNVTASPSVFMQQVLRCLLIILENCVKLQQEWKKFHTEALQALRIRHKAESNLAPRMQTCPLG
jgi:hypothetical protein